MEIIDTIISEHSFFAGMSPDLLHVITECASDVRFDAGSCIFKEGDEANAFYLIREGCVALEIFTPQKVIILDTLVSGDVLGWSWLLPPFHWRFNARAKADLEAIVLDTVSLRVKCEQNHDLGYELLKRFTRIVERRLNAMRSHLLDVYAEAEPQRHSKSQHIRSAGEGRPSDVALRGRESDLEHKKKARREEGKPLPSLVSR